MKSTDSALMYFENVANDKNHVFRVQITVDPCKIRRLTPPQHSKLLFSRLSGPRRQAQYPSHFITLWRPGDPEQSFTCLLKEVQMQCSQQESTAYSCMPYMRSPSNELQEMNSTTSRERIGNSIKKFCQKT